MSKDNDYERSKYKITGQSGLYYESDMSRIIDDPISDNIFSRLVKSVLSISIVVYAIGSYLSGVTQPISLSLIILAFVLYLICLVLNYRINVLLSLYKDDQQAFTQAVNTRKAFVILRYSVLAFSILSVILSIIGL